MVLLSDQYDLGELVVAMRGVPWEKARNRGTSQLLAESVTFLPLMGQSWKVTLLNPIWVLNPRRLLE